MKLLVIMACHNRRDTTVECILSAVTAAQRVQAVISFTIFDDGSSDGTAEAVSSLPIALRLLKGDGSAFWAKSMAEAETAVLGDTQVNDDDFLVWLNDDVRIDEEAFATLFATIATSPGAVVVGAMRDPQTGEPTYSGMMRAGLHPLKFEMVKPAESAQDVDTFNGNLVMVPVRVARQLGGIDGGFSHALADIDYGLRCGRIGIPLLLAPFTVGTCRRNVIPARRDLRHDWKAFTGPKGGGNFHSLQRILRKSHKTTWPFIIAATYSLWWARRLLARGT